MNVKNWLVHSTRKLEAAGSGTARLDALVLLEDATGTDRAHLLAHPELKLHKAQLTQLEKQIEQRAQHVPLAYIRGKTEFYGREFMVTDDVLEPRPETETMIELLKELKGIKTFIDVGTGSGAIIITAAVELIEGQFIGTDIDSKCLKIARLNADKHKATITVLEGDLLDSLISVPYSLPYALLCNLPYVPDDHTINEAAMNEPKLAIFGGRDGLDLYRKMFEQIEKLENKPTYILTESLPFQHQELKTIAQQHGYKQAKEEDFIQLFSEA